jgi:hypothetical protein
MDQQNSHWRSDKESEFVDRTDVFPERHKSRQQFKKELKKTRKKKWWRG